ncbi:MAG: TetR family transcriptional regulator C-terminal domain-containing protein [Nitratireductor sp.]|nr:TetR family transcriptional regulator C-terminal domain-containing protein [Nitratireductor sp.]MCB1458804.1 TetR family transcriptional regulator C-terminal domain-containing protein [Nitratireductor sp.]
MGEAENRTAGELLDRSEQAPRRRESKATRRDQLINATIDSLALRGYAATTLANVSDGAKLSRGIVNFHFDSKENLLLETLQFMSDEYAQNWEECLANAPQDTASRISVLVTADLDKKICTPRKVAAWFALMAEAKSRPAYQKLCWERDEKYRSVLEHLCRKARDEAGYHYDPHNVTAAIYAMQEGLWLRLMLSGRDYTRTTALAVVRQTLGALFPMHFTPEGIPQKEPRKPQEGKHP